MSIRWTNLGIMFGATVLALWFIYAVIFAFRTGQVGFPI